MNSLISVAILYSSLSSRDACSQRARNRKAVALYVCFTVSNVLERNYMTTLG